MFKKLDEVEARFYEIELRLSDPNISGNGTEFRKLSQEHSNLIDLVNEYKKFKKISAELQIGRAHV